MDFFFKALTYLVPLILSLTVHEYAHARVAYLLGDDTAARHGRMTLNPIPHIDLIGTILIPVFAVFSGGLPLIGWAKPVPVMPVRYTRKLSMHTGDILVSLAGPASNLILSALSIAVLRIAFNPDSLWACIYDVQPGNVGSLARYLLGILVIMNVGLGIFNLLPIPPLDGSHLLPRSLTTIMEKIRPFSYLILMGLIYFLYDWLLIPVKIILEILSLVSGVPV